MASSLTPAQRIELAHKAERQKRFADRIKAVLLRDQGWSFEQIAVVLLLDDSTVRRVQESYLKDELAGIAKDAYHGGTLKLTISEENLLKTHLQEVTYSSTKEIVAYIQQEFDVSFSISGVRQWLARNGFSHIKPRIVPVKASVEKQEEFLRQYRGIMSQLQESDKIHFADACHPIHNSVAGYGWMLKGNPVVLKTTSGRDRLNLNGAIDPIGLDVIVRQETS